MKIKSEGPQIYKNGDLPKQKVMGVIGEVKIPKIPSEVNMLKFKFPLHQQLAPDHTNSYDVTTFGNNALNMIKRFQDDELAPGQEVVVGGRVRQEEHRSRRTGEVSVKRQIFPIAVIPLPTPPNKPS